MAKKYLTNQQWNRRLRNQSDWRGRFSSRLLEIPSRFLSNRRFSTCQRFFLIIDFQPDKQLIISRFAPISSATYSPFILHKSPLSFFFFLLFRLWTSMHLSSFFRLARPIFHVFRDSRDSPRTKNSPLSLEIIIRIIRSLRRLVTSSGSYPIPFKNVDWIYYEIIYAMDV